MKKKIIAFLTAAATMLSSAPITANALKTEVNLWPIFLKYDLCIADYDALTEEEQQLCHFIYDTEIPLGNHIYCERARRILKHDPFIGERLTLDQFNNSTKINDMYSLHNASGIGYTHAVPDMICYDNFRAYNRYWLNDEGTVMASTDGDNYALFNAEQFVNIIRDNVVTDDYVIKTMPEYYNHYNLKKALLKYSELVKVNDGYYVINKDTGEASFLCTEYDDTSNYEEYEPNENNYDNRDYTYSDEYMDNSNYDEYDDNNEFDEWNDYDTYIPFKPVPDSFKVESEVNGYPVTAIDQGAFYYLPFEEITLPDTIKYIGSGAFTGCSCLKNINIPTGVEYIGTDAFSDCPALKQIIIDCPDLHISKGAFKNCSNLEKLYVNAKLIGEEAFEFDTDLCYLEFGNDVEEIGADAFSDDMNISRIDLPDSLRIIGEGAFDASKCTINIPASVEIIGALRQSYQYSDLDYRLTSESTNCFNANATIYCVPDSEAAEYLTKRHMKFRDLKVNLENPVVFSEDKTVLMKYPTARNEVMYSVPYGTIEIADGSFKGNKNIETLIIPSTVKYIGKDAFSECGLKSVTLPDSISFIGANAFANNRELTTVTIPQNVKSMNHPFEGCTKLNEVIISRPIADENELLKVNYVNLDSKDHTVYIYVPAASYYLYRKIIKDTDTLRLMPDDMLHCKPTAGDVNGDGRINVSDALLFKKYLHGKAELIFWYNGDLTSQNDPSIDRDHLPDIYDYLALLKKLTAVN